MSGAAVTWKDFLLKNLLPVTLGNIIGGAVLVAGVFSYAYGALGKD
jgi:formate/nitrite transporter FocA (FNT family)